MLRWARFRMYAVAGATAPRPHSEQTSRTQSGCVLAASLSQFATELRT